ncbi:MAG: TonB-dependent receptor [Gallionellaceae bacterium]|nr:TonB-dependent receptor [Gallionellaceae bacterium]
MKNKSLSLSNTAQDHSSLASRRKYHVQRFPLAVFVLFYLALNPVIATVAAAAPEVIASADLAHMTLEELGNIEVSSVSKKMERLGDAPAAIYVITRKDIHRSGATSLPEILRLAPNLQVARVDSSQYAITARGFNSTTANKLLVLIDGRSVYTPLYSGVFWDVQDVLLESIERIEVISGAGGTLWGANAVNGVINIITSKSNDTRGGLVSLGVGNTKNGARVSYTAKLNENASYRIYGKKINRDNTVRANGTETPDAWHKGQLGFRTDWANSSDTLVLQGDAYDGSIDQAKYDVKEISGNNLLARWDRTLQDGASLQVQTYYDHSRRIYPGTFGESLDTYDLDVQHGWHWGNSHDIVWGGGYRYSQDAVTNSTVLAFLPADKTLTLANLYAQDNIKLAENLQLTIGTRLEHNSYTGLEKQPNVRLAWKASDQTLLWSSIARAVRTPSRVDRELFAPGNPPYTLLNGGPNFQSEKLTAYEIGYRVEPSAQASFSLSIFYNSYDKLRSLELTGGALPYVLGNMMEGHTSGVETWGSYGINEWWQLKAGYTYLKKNMHLKPGSTDTTSLKSTDTDPSHQFSLRSMMSLTQDMDLDFSVRSVGGLPGSSVPAYVALDGRLGWKIAKNVEMSVSGFNLLDKRHPEFGTAPNRSEIGRAYYVRVLWDF